MKRLVCTMLIAVLMLGVLPVVAEQSPGVNEAVVVIDGETVVMTAVSMVRNNFQYGTQVVTARSPFSDYTQKMTVARIVQMESIKFVQVDPRSGLTLKNLELRIPGNWETGKTYNTESIDQVYGAPVIIYANKQTNSHCDSSNLEQKNTVISLIIDEANADYTMLKGRFQGEVAGIKFDISSFYVDKKFLEKNSAPAPTFPPLPTFPPIEPADEVDPVDPIDPFPPIVTNNTPTRCDQCKGTGICHICEGKGHIYYTDILQAECICEKYHIPGKCVKCGGEGQYTTPYAVMQGR